TGKVARDVTGSKGIQQAVADFIQGQDFVVYCDFNADADLQASAKRIARKLGVGVIHTQPAGKAILIGDPAQSLVIRQAGQFKHDISESWPGKGKGVILSHALLETTQHAAIVVAGSDAAAAQRAADAFEQVLLRNVKAPAGFTVWPATPADVIQPYTPAGHA